MRCKKCGHKPADCEGLNCTCNCVWTATCVFCGLGLHPANPSICNAHDYGHCMSHANKSNRCPECPDGFHIANPIQIHEEWEAWQEVMKEFRDTLKLGEPNDTKFELLFAKIRLWGEELSLLRRLQPIAYTYLSMKDDKDKIQGESK